MTLGRLIELYQAEQQGKQIMTRVYYSGYFTSYERINEVKISKIELKDLIIDEEEDTSCTFFIKGEEDKYGNKIER